MLCSDVIHILLYIKTGGPYKILCFYALHDSEKWFICNCRLCEKKRRATGENWPWRRRKPSTVPVFVWHLLNLMLQLVNGSLSLVLLVCLRPSGFGFICWRNYSVRRQLCYWLLLEHIWIENEIVLYSGIYKFEFCHAV